MSVPSYAQDTKTPLLSDKIYNTLKKITMVVLPATATLYFALAGIWSLPRAEEVVGSITALVTFLGVVLGLASKSYNKSDAKYVGALEVDEDPADGSKMYTLNFKDDNPEKVIQTSDEVTFKVQNS